MKRKPLFFLILSLLLATLACSLGGGEPTATPTPVVARELPTALPAATATPTAEPAEASEPAATMAPQGPPPPPECVDEVPEGWHSHGSSGFDIYMAMDYGNVAAVALKAVITMENGNAEVQTSSATIVITPGQKTNIHLEDPNGDFHNVGIYVDCKGELWSTHPPNN